MDLTEDSLFSLLLHLDEESISVLRKTSSRLENSIRKICTPHFWYLKFNNYACLKYQKQVTERGVEGEEGSNWRVALSTLQSINTRANLWHGTLFLRYYGVTSLSALQLTEELFGKIDWAEIFSVELLKRMSLSVFLLVQEEGPYLHLAGDSLEMTAKGDNLELFKYILDALEGTADISSTVLGHLFRRRTAKILQYLREEGLLSDKKLSY